VTYLNNPPPAHESYAPPPPPPPPPPPYPSTFPEPPTSSSPETSYLLPPLKLLQDPSCSTAPSTKCTDSDTSSSMWEKYKHHQDRSMMDAITRASFSSVKRADPSSLLNDLYRDNQL
jgi:hypothetical protein